jgi:UDP:flavonoid glycosyltransferase YjiC (YdhE family)
VPVVTLLHTFSAYWADQWSIGSPMGAWLRATATMPGRALPDAALLTTLAEFDPVDPRLPFRPGSLVQVGPVLDPMPQQAHPAADGHVLVSLSTISYPGQLGQLRKIVAALGGLDVRAIVTTGPAIDPGLIDAPPNVELHGFVPHHELIGGARLVVGHGGHGPTMTALAAGVPVIVLPMSRYADHDLIAAAVARTGAGVAMSRESSEEEWRVTITRLLADRVATQLARAVGSRIRATRATEAAVDVLERVARGG